MGGAPVGLLMLFFIFVLRADLRAAQGYGKIVENVEVGNGV